MLEKPCPASVACAWSIRRPRTSGMSVLLVSPLNTRRVTVAFCGAWVPAAGSVARDLTVVAAAVDARALHREAGVLELLARVVGVLPDDVRHRDRGLLLADDDGDGCTCGHVHPHAGRALEETTLPTWVASVVGCVGLLRRGGGPALVSSGSASATVLPFERRAR